MCPREVLSSDALNFCWWSVVGETGEGLALGDDDTGLDRLIPARVVSRMVFPAPLRPMIAALRRHHTQWSYLTMSDDPALADSFRPEHFVVVWPIGDGRPVLGDIFVGL
jgi:hypothetical protein